MMLENHIFISYAHVDNKTTPDSDGWVTRFHRYLESYLSMSLGGDAKIWRDEKLDGNDNFADKIIRQFPQTAALVSVISNRYVDSEWCIREADAFCHAASEHPLGLRVNDKTRLFKVKITPIDREKRARLPGPMQDILGYEFFEEMGEKTLLLDPEFGVEYGQAYKQKIYLLAQDIAEMVRLVSNGASEKREEPKEQSISEPLSAKDDDLIPVVFLAECGYDQSSERTKLYGRLREEYTVLPDKDLPRNEDAYREEVHSMLKQCDLSIHLIGKGNGGILDGPGLISPVQVQHELALKYSEERGMNRLIWLPEDVKGDAPAHQEFLDVLVSDSRHLLNGDKIAGNIKEFEKEIFRTLDRLASEKNEVPIQVPGDESGPNVYVICDAKDLSLEDFRQLLVFLKSQNFDISVPLFTGEATKVQKANEMHIHDCDAVLMFFGAGDGAWQLAQYSELKRVLGMRTNNQLLASYTYLGGEETPDKQILQLTSSKPLIDGLKGFKEEAMMPFIRQVKAGK